MKRLRWGATITTCIAGLCVAFLWNSALALPVALIVKAPGQPPVAAPRYCVLLFEVPWTGTSFEFPYWTMNVALAICVLSTIAAIALWAAMIIKHRWHRSVDVQATEKLSSQV